MCWSCPRVFVSLDTVISSTALILAPIFTRPLLVIFFIFIFFPPVQSEFLPLNKQKTASAGADRRRRRSGQQDWEDRHSGGRERSALWKCEYNEFLQSCPLQGTPETCSILHLPPCAPVSVNCRESAAPVHLDSNCARWPLSLPNLSGCTRNVYHGCSHSRVYSKDDQTCFPPPPSLSNQIWIKFNNLLMTHCLFKERLQLNINQIPMVVHWLVFKHACTCVSIAQHCTDCEPAARCVGAQPRSQRSGFGPQPGLRLAWPEGISHFVISVLRVLAVCSAWSITAS